MITSPNSPRQSAPIRGFVPVAVNPTPRHRNLYNPRHEDNQAFRSSTSSCPQRQATLSRFIGLLPNLVEQNFQGGSLLSQSAGTATTCLTGDPSQIARKGRSCSLHAKVCSRNSQAFVACLEQGWRWVSSLGRGG